MSEPERIEAAAISYKGRIWTVPRPGRHHDVLRVIWGALGDGPVIGETQGFLTSTGRFVRREPAMRIARKAKQILKEPTFQPRTLFSEDVW